MRLVKELMRPPGKKTNPLNTCGILSSMKTSCCQSRTAAEGQPTEPIRVQTGSQVRTEETQGCIGQADIDRQKQGKGISKMVISFADND